MKIDNRLAGRSLALIALASAAYAALRLFGEISRIGVCAPVAPDVWAAIYTGAVCVGLAALFALRYLAGSRC